MQEKTVGIWPDHMQGTFSAAHYSKAGEQHASALPKKDHRKTKNKSVTKNVVDAESTVFFFFSEKIFYHVFIIKLPILQEHQFDRKLRGDFLPEQGIWGNGLTSVLIALYADQYCFRLEPRAAWISSGRLQCCEQNTIIHLPSQTCHSCRVV